MDKKTQEGDAELNFIEREQALVEERRYTDLQQSPDCGKVHKRIKEATHGNRR